MTVVFCGPGEQVSRMQYADPTAWWWYHGAEYSKKLHACRDLHYAHNGGFDLELYDADMNKIHEWAAEDHRGCQVDATKQNVTIDLPAEPCPGCVLRFQRQALEWGDGYLFKSCALLDIVAEADADAEAACNGCSGHGTCGAGGACTCDSSAETGFFYGTHCEYEDECAADADCGTNGKCVNVGDVSGPANQVQPSPPSLSVDLVMTFHQELVG